MIDNTTIVIPHILDAVSNQDHKSSISLFGITCKPYFNNSLIGYRGKESNIIIKANGRGISLSGSWHTFFSDSNHTKYTISQIQKTYEFWQKKTDAMIDEAYVSKCEVGINIDHLNFESWKEYGRNITHKMLSKNKHYGTKGKMTNTEIKAYDKTFERKRKNIVTGKQLYRLESTLLNRRTIESKINVKSPSDFTDPTIMYNVSSHLKNEIDKITMVDNIDINSLSVTEFKILKTYSNLLQADLEYLRSKSIYKRDRATFKRIIRESEGEQKEKLNNEIDRTFDILLNT